MVGTKELCFACHILIFGANKKIIEHVKKNHVSKFLHDMSSKPKRTVAMGQVECQTDDSSYNFLEYRIIEIVACLFGWIG
jgi:hypothetical protein